MTRDEALYKVKGYLTDLIPAENYSEVEEIIKALEQEPHEDCISRQDAIDAIERNAYRHTYLDQIIGIINSLPSADKPTTDCTKFMEWLKAEVLDEENWELNAIANGEIICRKLKKMGWLDVEDGFYVDTRPTGKWIEDKYCDRHCICSNCGGSSGTQFDGVQLIPLKTKFCPNCGADMNETRADDDE